MIARRCVACVLAVVVICQSTDLTVQARAETSPEVVSQQVDALFAEAWRSARVQPASHTDDATFLRRVTLDLTGIVPEIGQARRFLADNRPDKRTRLIDELLDRPRHATHLANVWREVLLPRTVPESTFAGFESWLRERFRNNVPYDQLVREILLARGTLSQSPPVIYYAALDTKPAELAASTSRMFLGVQIRCAECHDHPFANWRQEDFWSLVAFFARVRGPAIGGGVALLDDGPSGEVQHPVTKKTVPPRFLDGTAAPTATGEPRRAMLARWITSVENPYFARAAVNRAWWLMFGRGLIDPVDDLGEHNPPTHPEVLDLLTADFISHGYDLRRLLRILAGTQVYQLSSDADASSDHLADYTSMPVRSLSAEQVYDCLVQAAGRRDPLDPQAPELLEQRRLFLAQVEAPTRQPTTFQGGIPQALALLNGPFVQELTGPDSGDLVVALTDNPFLSDEQRVDALYLTALTRFPNTEERRRALDWVQKCQKSGDVAQAYSDVLWALLNCSEFILKQ